MCLFVFLKFSNNQTLFIVAFSLQLLMLLNSALIRQHTLLSITVASMRNHLTTCLENDHFEPFPKESSRLRNVMIDINGKVKTVEISCQCGMPDFVDDIVGCETRKCGRWYHLRCVGVSKGQKCSLVCEKCTKEHSFSVQ